MGVEVKETGHASDEERSAAAMFMLEAIWENPDWDEKVTVWEGDFINNIGGNNYFSAKQYFKLKDIYDKLVERGVI